MTVLMVRSKIRPEVVGDVDAAVERLFAAIHRAQPEGIRYASTRLPDGVTFVIFLALDEGVDNPLPALPEFQEFQENLKKWMAEPPAAEQLTVVGSYRLF
jgi:hypothetical protein